MRAKALLAIVLLALLGLWPRSAHAQGVLPIDWSYLSIFDVSSVSYSPDGTRLAIAGGGVQLFNATSGAAIRGLLLGTDLAPITVYAVAFSPDSRTIAVGGYGDSGVALEILDASTGAVLKSFATDLHVVNVAFSPDGTKLADVGDGAEVWDVSNGELLQSLDTIGYSVAFESDSRTLLVGEASGVEFWNVPSGLLLTTFHTKGQVDAVAISQDGTTVADGGQASGSDFSVYGFLELWDVSTGKRISSLDTGCTNVVNSVAFSPNGQTLADGGQGAGDDLTTYGVAELWNVSSGTLVKSLDTAAVNAGAINAVAYSPDGQTVIDGGFEAYSSDSNASGVLEKWNPSTGELLSSLIGQSAAQYYSVTFSPDGKTVADVGSSVNTTYDYYGVLDLWNVASGIRRSLDIGTTSSLNSVAFTPNGKTLAVGGYGFNPAPITSGILQLWDVATGKRIRALDVSDTASVNSVAISPDGKTLAVGNTSSKHACLELWDVTTGALLEKLQTGADRSIFSVAFSPDGKTICAAGDASVLEIWSVATGKLVRNLDSGVSRQLSTVIFSPDGKRIADGGSIAGKGRGVVELWNVADGRRQALLALKSPDEEIAAVAFSPDGKVLFVGGNSDLEGFDTTSYGLLSYYNQFTSIGAKSIAFSPDGSHFVYGTFYGVLAIASNPYYHHNP